MDKNRSLQSARKAKNDEFYTQLSDIENELKHYIPHFRGKTVFCNCDDPEASNFWRYFAMNFDHLGLKRLITTHYVRGGLSYALEMKKGDKFDLFSADPARRIPLRGDGDFRSEECVDLLKQADIVVTNPPFSLFREYLRQLVEHEKKFLIIGNKNSITYKEVFGLIKDGKLWLGHRNINSDMWFYLPDDAPDFEKIVEGRKTKHLMGCWFTNMDHAKRHEEVEVFRSYGDNPSYFPKYDNFDAFDVSYVKDIPEDYLGNIGVPITYLDQHNPDQFEIIRFRKGDDGKDLSVQGKCPYFRIVTRRKQ